MMRALIIVLIMLLPTLVWARIDDDDLKACQAQTATLTMQVRDAQQMRKAYAAELGEIIADMRANLANKDAQIQQLMQELQRLKAPKPEEKK